MGVKRNKEWRLDETLKLFFKKKKSMPKKIGNIAKNHFIQSFRDGGFKDKSLRKWRRRKQPDKKGKGRAILIKSGKLRRSIRVKRATSRGILITAGGAGIDYAAVHNRGMGKMPKRQFMGKSIILNKKVRKRIRREVDQVFSKTKSK